MNKFFAIILTITFTKSVFACENCPALQANIHEASGAYIFKEYTFENKQDLAIIDLQAEVRRVTFGRGNATTTCFFQPLAFVQGGEGDAYWGWHMLWQEGAANSHAQGLFYARMDGKAWVSSNPKRLTKFMPINPQFKLDNHNISVTWQQVENNIKSNMQAVSSDEGRSWVITQH
jgi:hypothetical protein